MYIGSNVRASTLLEHELDLDFLFEFMKRDNSAAPKEGALCGAHYQYDGGYVLNESHSTCIIIQKLSFPDFSLTFRSFPINIDLLQKIIHPGQNVNKTFTILQCPKKKELSRT